MNFLGNILWLIFGGILISLLYFIASIGLFITIIGIPFGIQTLKLSLFAMWPFEKEVRETEESGGCLSIIMNLIWIFYGGIWISVIHLILGILFSITIIGLPWGKQHFKMAGLALAPFGKEIVDTSFQQH